MRTIIDYKDLVSNANTYKVYVKKATDEVFALIGGANIYNEGYAGLSWAKNETGAWENAGLTFRANGAHVKHAVSAKAYSGTYYESIEDIVGAPVAITHKFELNENSSTQMYDKGTGATGIYYRDDKIDMGTHSEDGYLGGSWRFTPYAGWEPLNSDGGESMFGFTAKTGNGFKVDGYFNGGRLRFNIKPNVDTTSNMSVANSTDFKPCADWSEYLVSNYKSGSNVGYRLWMRNERTTNNKWVSQAIVPVASTTAISNLLGIRFVDDDVDTYIKNVKVYSITNAVVDEETIPVGATKLYYEENFERAPVYPNYTNSGANTKYNDGVMTMWEGVDQPASAMVNNGRIPLGGYAELRLNAGDSPYGFSFADGTKSYKVDYSLIAQTFFEGENKANVTIGEDAEAYRTWRIVHNEDGTYSAYTRLDGEDNWFAADVNADGKADGSKPQFKLDASTCYFTVSTAGTDNPGSSGGQVKLDYLKIYGPEPDGNLTLFDGYGTKVLENTDTVQYPGAIRVMNQNADGKFLVVAYKNDCMIKAQFLNANEVSDSLVNGTEEGATTIKVFLWDGFDKIIPAVNNYCLTIAR